MFRALICSSSGLCDYIVELQHWPFRSWFAVCWEFRCGSAGVVSGLQAEASAGNPDTTPAEPHPDSNKLQPATWIPPQPNRTQTPNTQQTNNETANVVVQQYSRIILKMSILMPEAC